LLASFYRSNNHVAIWPVAISAAIAIVNLMTLLITMNAKLRLEEIGYLAS
jgi:uncharacterized membrane protein YdfJ with MMPL/SSD domain